MTQTKQTAQLSQQPISRGEVSVVDQVLSKIIEFQRTGQLNLPKDYDPATSLKAAYLVLLETEDKNNKPVLESCTKTSVANALLGMVVQGLSPIKKQCYFIAYGNKLTLSRSYQGTVAIAKRAGLKDIVANIIYESDVFSFEIDTVTGRHRILEHKTALENIDINKIKGAYAVTTMHDGTQEVEIMTIQQIKNSWMQGAAKGNSPAHQKFTDEMAKKTVIARACKGIVNSSNDSYLLEDDEDSQEIQSIAIEEKANTTEIGFTDDQEQNAVQKEPEQNVLAAEPPKSRVKSTDQNTEIQKPDF